jgi:WhiB family transcriptional regulator, redox-sensing transcriptional regulator
VRQIIMNVSDDWMDFARCKEMKADVFFSDEKDKVGVLEAKKVCSECPVIDPCLDMGMKMRHGIWGGLTAKERSLLRSIE